jgi:hypothetical protein
MLYYRMRLQTPHTSKAKSQLLFTEKIKMDGVRCGNGVQQARGGGELMGTHTKGLRRDQCHAPYSRALHLSARPIRGKYQSHERKCTTAAGVDISLSRSGSNTSVFLVFSETRHGRGKNRPQKAKTLTTKG